MKTILIIEDDIVFSRSISNWLVKKGMKTECVATLANARKAIGQKEFDLILADLRLPDGNSTSLLKWMNEKYYSIPFLIMTNYGQVENAVTTMQLGAINYLCKPVQPDNLLALITEILDKNDNEQEFYRGESPKAHEMYRLIEMIACADIISGWLPPPMRIWKKPSEKDASGKTCSTGSMSSLCGFLHWQNAGKTSFLWLIFS